MCKPLFLGVCLATVCLSLVVATSCEATETTGVAASEVRQVKPPPLPPGLPRYHVRIKFVPATGEILVSQNPVFVFKRPDPEKPWKRRNIAFWCKEYSFQIHFETPGHFENTAQTIEGEADVPLFTGDIEDDVPEQEYKYKVTVYVGDDQHVLDPGYRVEP